MRSKKGVLTFGFLFVIVLVILGIWYFSGGASSLVQYRSEMADILEDEYFCISEKSFTWDDDEKLRIGVGSTFDYKLNGESSPKGHIYIKHRALYYRESPILEEFQVSKSSNSDRYFGIGFTHNFFTAAPSSVYIEELYGCFKKQGSDLDTLGLLCAKYGVACEQVTEDEEPEVIDEQENIDDQQNQEETKSLNVFQKFLNWIKEFFGDLF